MYNDLQTLRTFTLSTSDKKAEAVISSLGAALISLKLPATRKEKMDGKENIDVVLGYQDLESYKINEPSLGVVVGRVAGRISYGKFNIGNSEYHLTKNLNGIHCLHGGLKGLYHVIWHPVLIDQNSVVLSYTSEHLEDGFPGSIHVQVTYKLDKEEDREIYSLKLKYKATMRDYPCPINITNHSYFNLAGHESGRVGLSHHLVQILSKKTLELDENTLLPTGNVIDTTGFKDLASGKKLDAGIDSGGYDLFYILEKNGEKLACDLIPNCQFSALDINSGRQMLGLTDQIGVQFYTGACIAPHQPKGKHGDSYEKFGGLCFETQSHPDAINLPKSTYGLPNIIYYPDGEPYEQETTFYFFDSMCQDSEDF